MLSHPFIALHLAGIQASAGDIAALEQSKAVIAAKEPVDETRLASGVPMLSVSLLGGSTLRQPIL